MFTTFSAENFHQICDQLASRDKELLLVVQKYSYPPMWSRPNTFESLVHIILEQQVSLASALATLNKLREKIKEVNPERLLSLTDEELRACYFSRQKTGYVRQLARAITEGTIDLENLAGKSNEDIRTALSRLKGIGNWTIDIYLIFVLQRTDIFPVGDLAAVNALKQLKKLPKDTPRETILELSLGWQPNRTVATMLLWHYYLSVRAKQ